MTKTAHGAILEPIYFTIWCHFCERGISMNASTVRDLNDLWNDHVIECDD